MDFSSIAAIAVGAPSTVAAGAFAWIAVNLQWIRRDVDKSHSRIDKVLEKIEKMQSGP